MNYTKIIPSFLIILLLAACSNEKLKMADAKKCVAEYMDAIQQKDFNKASSFYASELSGHSQQKIEEMKKLDSVFGEINTAELIDSIDDSGDIVNVKFANNINLNDSTDEYDEDDEESNIQLTYKIKHSKLVSNEKFVIVKEDGIYKIKEHQVQSGIE
jgi:hypothetical protein